MRATTSRTEPSAPAARPRPGSARGARARTRGKPPRRAGAHRPTRARRRVDPCAGREHNERDAHAPTPANSASALVATQIAAGATATNGTAPPGPSLARDLAHRDEHRRRRERADPRSPGRPRPRASRDRAGRASDRSSRYPGGWPCTWNAVLGEVAGEPAEELERGSDPSTSRQVLVLRVTGSMSPCAPSRRASATAHGRRPDSCREQRPPAGPGAKRGAGDDRDADGERGAAATTRAPSSDGIQRRERDPQGAPEYTRSTRTTRARR